MRDADRPMRPAFEDPPSPAEEGKDAGLGLGEAMLLGAFAVTAGGVVLAIAITWGAAEAAVGVGASYLVYSALAGRADQSGTLAVRLLTGAFRRHPE